MQLNTSVAFKDCSSQNPNDVLSYMRDESQTDDVFYNASIDMEKTEDVLSFFHNVNSENKNSNERPSVAEKSEDIKPSKKTTAVAIDRFGRSSPYFKQLNKLDPFTRKEEEEVFKKYTHLHRKIERYKNRPHLLTETTSMEKELLEIRNLIVTRNLKFVVKLAKSFWMDGSPETLENLISSGNVGLIRAVSRFEISKGVRFLTYAANWIALEMRIEVSNVPLVKIPVWWQKTLKKLLKVYNELSDTKNTEEIPVEDLAKKSQVPIKHIKKLADNNDVIKACNFTSLQPELPFCEKSFLSETVIDAEKLIIQESAKKYVECVCNLLPDVEKKVISRVFGLENGEPQNLRQISNLMGNTGERVRQLKEKGLTTLREKIIAAGLMGNHVVSSFNDIL